MFLTSFNFNCLEVKELNVAGGFRTGQRDPGTY